MTKDELRKSLDFVCEERDRLQRENEDLSSSIIDYQEAIDDYYNELKRKDHIIKTLKDQNINEILKKDLELCAKQFSKSEKKVEKLQQRIETAIDKVQDIIDIGFDYDGYNDVDNLKILVDELVDLARQTKNILNGRSNK